MATTTEGERLTETHRVQQARISAATLLAMSRIWPILRSGREDSRSLWLEAALAVIRRQRRASALLAATYLREYRRIELPSAELFTPRPVVEINLEKVVTSLNVTGPVALQKTLEEQADRLGRRVTKADLADTLPPRFEQAAMSKPAAAAMRHVADGAWDTLDNAVEEDRLVKGWARVTGANPCFWCAMLASRGPVFKSDSFADSDVRFTGPGNHKVHDGCGCKLEVVYHDDTKWPGRAREFEQLWKSAAEGKSGASAILAFRQAYEGR